MTAWQPIETAPKDGEFLARQEGEIYVARYSDDGRLCYRTHKLNVQSRYAVIETKMNGDQVKALVEIDKPWAEMFSHDWTFWERGFDFSPSQWAHLPDDEPS